MFKATLKIFILLHFQIQNVKTIGVMPYDMKCPHRSHWHTRAKIYQCEKETVYHCLYDNNTKNLTEKCTKPDDIPPGTAFQ